MPLTGMRVIEVCSNLAGPVTGTIFGDLGADVIKVEKSNGGDDARGWAPLWNDHGAPFQAINRNKRSVALDFRRGEDVAKLKSLVLDADVFVHNMRPGAAEALGLSGPELRAYNPRLIYCAIGAYGEQGPWRERSAYDGLAQALSGQMSGNGFPDSEPLLIPGGVVDKGAGMWAAIGTLGALVRRARTGEGAIVGTSLLEAALFWRDIGFAHYQATGQTPLPAGQHVCQHRSLWRVPDRRRPGHARLCRRQPVLRLGCRAGSQGVAARRPVRDQYRSGGAPGHRGAGDRGGSEDQISGSLD
jgi:crotonobetainyl-CoA:carnitine CoA-transferase CaiB-like acyl-CoA transferase